MTDASTGSIRHLNDCGCCEGLTVETPSEIVNRPGLSAIEYRVGTHPDFLNSMLARLSVSGLAPLQELSTRERDDFTIALLDGWATVADVLTFYQERLSNENYLRTATERISVLELARLIDYRLHPGVAASTYLAFTLDEPKGPVGSAALNSPEIITIDKKTKVQSTPGPDEEAQTFETIEPIEARVEWNAIRPQQIEIQTLGFGHQQAYLEGITLGLNKGDVLLFVSEAPSLSADEIAEAAATAAADPVAAAAAADPVAAAAAADADSVTATIEAFTLAIEAVAAAANASNFATDATNATDPDKAAKAAEAAADAANAAADAATAAADAANAAADAATAADSAVGAAAIAAASGDAVAADAAAASAAEASTYAVAAGAAAAKAAAAESFAEAAAFYAAYPADTAAAAAKDAADTAAKDAADAATAAGLAAIVGDAVAAGAAAAKAASAAAKAAKAATPPSEAWNIRTVVSVEDPDPEANHTLVKWGKGLGHVNNPKVYVFRHQASLFGHNAPDWRAMADKTKTAFLIDAGYENPDGTENPFGDGGGLDSVFGHDLSVDPRNDSEWPKFNIAYRSLKDILEDEDGGIPQEAMVKYKEALDKSKEAKNELDLAENLTKSMAELVNLRVRKMTEAYRLYLHIRRHFTDFFRFLSDIARALGFTNPWEAALVKTRQAYSNAVTALGDARNAAEAADEAYAIKQSNFKKALRVAEEAADEVEFQLEVAQQNLELKTLYLDSAYTEVLKDSWVMLTFKDSIGTEVTQLASIDEVIQGAQAQFLLSGKSTRLLLKERIRWDFFYKLREASAYVQSELLPLAPLPLTSSVTGSKVNLDGRFFSLKEGHRLIVSGPEYGNASAVAAAEEEDVKARDLVDTETARFFDLVDDLENSDPVANSEGYLALNENIEIAEEDASRASAAAEEAEIELIQARITADDILANDPNAPAPKMLAEVVTISEINHEGKWAQLTVTPALEGKYQRDKAVIFANVVLATHGETVHEMLGSGDAGQSFQEFELRQKPLTHIIDGQVVTTLEVRIDDILWKEVRTLYGHGPNEHVFKTKSYDDGTVVVQFGDGIAGARPSSGQDNVRAVYRKGIGTPGLVRANQLNNLMSRPLGLKEAINPLPARDADDPERMENARDNAPLTVKTLDRAVSLQDYADFARSFGGIHKAQATRFVDSYGPGVFVTVAGTDGAIIEEGGELFKGLKASFKKSGDPHVRFLIKSYRPAYFEVSAKIKVHSDYIEAKVVADAEAALRSAFSFQGRELEQPLMWSEVISAVQDVPGVVAVDLNSLNRVGELFDPENPNPNLPADLPNNESGSWESAEILMLDPELQFFITVMQ
jgi:hypothetical protein